MPRKYYISRYPKSCSIVVLLFFAMSLLFGLYTKITYSSKMATLKILNLINLLSTIIINFVSVLYINWVRSKEYANILNKFAEVDKIVHLWQKAKASISFRYHTFASQFLFVVIYVTIIYNWIYDSNSERLKYLVLQNVQRHHMITFQMHACYLIYSFREKNTNR